jgi:hypothetical protein
MEETQRWPFSYNLPRAIFIITDKLKFITEQHNK